jgi:hypothetical protein
MHTLAPPSPLATSLPQAWQPPPDHPGNHPACQDPGKAQSTCSHYRIYPFGLSPPLSPTVTCSNSNASQSCPRTNASAHHLLLRKSSTRHSLAVGVPGPISYGGSTRPSLPFLGSAPRSLAVSIARAELSSICRRRGGGGSGFATDLFGIGEEYLIISGLRSNGLRCEGRGKTQYGEGEIAIVSNSTANPPRGEFGPGH